MNTFTSILHVSRKLERNASVAMQDVKNTYILLYHVCKAEKLARGFFVAVEKVLIQSGSFQVHFGPSPARPVRH